MVRMKCNIFRARAEARSRQAITIRVEDRDIETDHDWQPLELNFAFCRFDEPFVDRKVCQGWNGVGGANRGVLEFLGGGEGGRMKGGKGVGGGIGMGQGGT